MKVMIKDVNYESNTFSAIIGGKKTYFYLTNRLAKIYINSLSEDVLVDFVITKTTKTINNKKHYQIKHFTLIENYKRNVLIYSHEELKEDMINFLKKQNYFLFLDLEMTMPNYYQRRFIPEIIQYGYLLVDKDGNIIKSNANYLNTKLTKRLNKHTVRFLNLDVGNYEKVKKPFNIFYEELKDIKEKFNPKIVVWGKNDIKALKHAYNIYKLKEITDELDFIDLLKLHKDYFNLINDLGLFKAYETYYNKSVHQHHDAKDDAKITKKVFDAFIMYTNEEKEREV